MMLAAGAADPLVAARSAETSGRIGPNAVLQAREALAALLGAQAVSPAFAAAGLTHHLVDPPGTMIDQRDPAALFRAIRRLHPGEADQLLADAGHRTGRYILANRIPSAAARLLRVLPAPVSARLLTLAISRHAWTFCGSGRFSATVSGIRHPLATYVVMSNPLATPGCPWHCAVFETLLADLVRRPVSVRHVTCCAQGDAACTTLIAL